MKEIEKQTGYSFVYNEKIDVNAQKSVVLKGKDLAAVLESVFDKTDIRWKISGKHILLFQQSKSARITLSGYVTDRESGETLIGASISDLNTRMGKIANSYGYYTLQLPPGPAKLRISYIGYKSEIREFYLTGDTVMNFKLYPGHELAEVVITNKKSFSPSGSSIELDAATIKSVPALFGETDVLKSLTYIPGVQSGVEGTAGMYVRGGGGDQNLVLLDGIPVYNTGHVYGLFSIFNGDAVKNVSFHKGSFPARFGGRLSSVVDVRLKDGDLYQYKGTINVGLLSSRFNFEGPLVKGRTSFNISARRSYMDAFLRLGKLFTDEPVPILYIYDLNAKINHRFSDKSRIYLSFYSGEDKVEVDKKATSEYWQGNTFYEKGKLHYGWGNTVASLRWNYVFSNKLFVNSTIAYNRYLFDYSSYEEYGNHDTNSYYKVFQNSGIKDRSISSDFEYAPDEKHKIRFGGSFMHHQFNPEVRGTKEKEIEEGVIQLNKTNHYLNDRILGKEFALYVEDEFPVFNKLKANTGAHFSLFNVQGKTYKNFQPRISLGYEINHRLAVKASYTRMNQYVNLLSSNALSQPNDLWVPITKELKPMESDQFTVGGYSELTGYYFSLEAFYKKMNNVLEYKDGTSWKDSYEGWESQVEAGKGRAYGIELFARKTLGKITGWAGYALAWNDRQFETINNGKRFFAKYDRRHDISILLSYRINPKIELSSSWMYATGNNATLPIEEYQSLPDPGVQNSWDYGSSGSISHMEKRNNYRLPANHHLDLNLNYRRSDRKMWSFSIYNVYNRLNPFIIYQGHSEKTGRNTLYKSSLFRIVPSVSFTYKFK